MHRIVDDLPFTADAVKLCFGSLHDCFEVLLTGASAETSSLMSSLMIKMAKHNLPEAMLPYANRKLPNRLKIHWPGCLETALSLLVALSHDCYRGGHEHPENFTSKQENNPCIAGSVEAIVKYIEEANHIKYLMSCLVALQDLSPIMESRLLEPYKHTIVDACYRVGIGTKVLWKDMWMEVAANSSPYSKLAVKMDFRKWLDAISRQVMPKNIRSKPVSMSSLQDTDYLSSDRSSSSLTTISSSSSGKPPILDSVTDSTSAPLQVSSPDQNGDHQSLTKETNAPSDQSLDEDKSVNESTNSELSSTSTSTSFSHASDNRTQMVSKSLPRQYEVFDSVASYPNAVIRKPTPIKTNELRIISDTNPSGVRRVQSVKYSEQPSTEENEKRVVAVQRSHSSYRPGQVTFRSISSRTNPNQIKVHTLSSPQLSPLDSQDPIQRFHQRYYDKLLQYINALQSQFPLPFAVSYQNPEKIRKGQKGIPKDFVWFVNHYDYQSRDRKIEGSMDSCGVSTTLNRPDRRELHLHFACSHRQTQCIYPGRNLSTCFDVKTKYPLLWLQVSECQSPLTW
ncbi:unnamed protein product [Echinostoma caproni]|uniref:Ubiquitinyl hydrolase 1 n=1 Tax=Echinostoma caproni TaxID=27848 RepID=A0A182ZZE4_9TREM|nr:unnamed protein product [Echinostoma caproni]